MNIRNYPSVKARREAVEAEKQVTLSHLGRFSLDEERAAGKHCENMIGAVQIPVGIAGPLSLQWQDVNAPDEENKKVEAYIPLATTEGALVASISRGCKAITLAGGCLSIIEDVGTSRGPVFQTVSLATSLQFVARIKSHQLELKDLARSTSSHLELISITTQVVGTLVYVRFSFTTGLAMGMNMVTIASQKLADYLATTCQVQCLGVSGNACVDKKPSWQNTISGRGIRAWSEVYLTTNIITDLLKTTPAALVASWQAKCLIGGAVAGNLGFNGHAANIIAALYLATGQDPAHVVEGSQTITTMSLDENGVRVSVYLPAVLVGSVGGGTGLETQQEALSLLECVPQDPDSKSKLAAIVAGAVLAGEISELAALSSGTLTVAHQQLAR